MGDVRDALEAHLRPLGGPFLFVGAGLTRRYAGLPNWEGLLRRFAGFTDKPYEYYLGAAGSDLPLTASKIAEEFYEVWWNAPEYEASRQENSGAVTDGASALKIEVSRFVDDELAKSTIPAELTDEWELLRQATVDGIITTNYDGLLKEAFPDFEVFVGQEQLLFADTQGIAETYMIHGSAAEPESLVLTQEDYKDYQARNPYLAAKLLTIFVEHPVLFLGYSLGDANVNGILHSLVQGLRAKNIDKLQKRLIFVEWKQNGDATISETVVMVDGVTIPITRVIVPDFREVFGALGARERAIPAKWLRILKEQVYEIVLSNDPRDRLVAYADIDSATAEDISVVFGVGAKMAIEGIVGLPRLKLFADVLDNPDGAYPAAEIVERLLPTFPTRSWFPVFKYLRGAGLVADDGSITDATKVPRKVATRAALHRRVVVTTPPAGKRRQRMARITAKYDDRWIFTEALNMPGHTNDPDGFRDYLVAKEPLSHTNAWWAGQYGKLIVAYDYMKYGPRG